MGRPSHKQRTIKRFLLVCVCVASLFKQRMMQETDGPGENLIRSFNKKHILKSKNWCRDRELNSLPELMSAILFESWTHTSLHHSSFQVRFSRAVSDTQLADMLSDNIGSIQMCITCNRILTRTLKLGRGFVHLDCDK